MKAKMKVYTTLDTLSEAWMILNELGLGALLTGKAAAFEPENLLGRLLGERKLQEFIGCITHKDPDEVGELGAEDALEILNAFFGDIGSAFHALPTLAEAVSAKPAPPKPKPKAKPKG